MRLVGASSPVWLRACSFAVRATSRVAPPRISSVCALDDERVAPQASSARPATSGSRGLVSYLFFFSIACTLLIRTTHRSGSPHELSSASYLELSALPAPLFLRETERAHDRFA